MNISALYSVRQELEAQYTVVKHKLDSVDALLTLGHHNPTQLKKAIYLVFELDQEFHIKWEYYKAFEDNIKSAIALYEAEYYIEGDSTDNTIKALFFVDIAVLYLRKINFKLSNMYYQLTTSIDDLICDYRLKTKLDYLSKFEQSQGFEINNHKISYIEANLDVWFSIKIS